MTKAKPGNELKRQEQMAARAAAIEKVEAALVTGPKTVQQLWHVAGGLRATLVGYLGHMHKMRRTIRPTGEKLGHCGLWELGTDPSLPTLDEELDRIFAPKRGTHPARQIGMWREPLVAALFGPAHHQ